MYLRSLAWRLFLVGYYFGESTGWNTCICDEDLSLKTRVVTNPGSSHTNRRLTLEHISDWGQPPCPTRPRFIYFIIFIANICDRL